MHYEHIPKGLQTTKGLLCYLCTITLLRFILEKADFAAVQDQIEERGLIPPPQLA